MDANGLAPREILHNFPSDTDRPPPRKKASRFFSGGKSLIGSISSRNKETSDNHENLTPLIDDEAYIDQPRHKTALLKAAGSMTGKEEDKSVQSPPQTGDLASSTNPFATSTLLSNNRTVRNRRRDGIIGMESLLGPASGVPTAGQVGGHLLIGEGTSPFQSSSSRPNPIHGHDVTQMSSEDAVRLQAARGNSNQSLSQRYGQSQLSSSASSHEPWSTLHNALPHQGPHPRLQADEGPLNAPPPPVRTSQVSLNDTNLRWPLLPRPLVATGVDMDRDYCGRRLAEPPRPILNIPNQGITNLPLHATLNPTRRYKTMDPTFYTSPDRILNAWQVSRKRKRTTLITPPTAFTYQRTDDPNFNVFNGFLLYPELVFHLASILPLRDLISLYAISRDFHTIIDTRFTTVVLSQSLRKAPECSRAFPFRCYKYLCRTDPAARIPHPNPQAAAAGKTRLIPSFRWLAFILHREKVVHEIMALFAEDGVPLPRRCSLALKRMWFILDIPDNARRIGYIHNINLFTDLDLYFSMCFFVKLDMRMNDPMGEQKRDGMRKMLLAQRNLTTILRVLKRDIWQSQFDIMRAWIQYKYDPLPDEVGMTIFGVPSEEVGKMRFEYWGEAKPFRRVEQAAQLLLRPDQLVMREAVKRGLRFHKHFLRCLTYGYVRLDTLEDYEPRKMNRRKESLKDEYDIDDEIGGLTWSMEKAGLEDGSHGDLLDLGEQKSVSLLCIEGGSQSMISDEDRLKMEEEEYFLEACMRWSEAEREEGDVDAKTLLN